jgi:hypothetical protein
MNVAQLTTALVLAQTCGGSSTPDPILGGGFSCSEYQRMLDLDIEYGSTCSTDDECTEILDGTGCGCVTSNLIANSDFDTGWFYETLDEARSYSCDITFDTACDCDESLEPTCSFARCTWQ